MSEGAFDDQLRTTDYYVWLGMGGWMSAKWLMALRANQRALRKKLSKLLGKMRLKAQIVIFKAESKMLT